MTRIFGNASYANRGREFENFLHDVHERYMARGIACVQKVPTEFLPLRDGRGTICGCKVEHKSCVDYLGRFRSVPVAVEAKHTDDGRIRFDRVEPHQADYMDAFCAEPGTVGIVIVSFEMRRFFAVPWPFWKVARESWEKGRGHGVRAIIQSHGQTWQTPGMASAAPGQLLPEWEVMRKGLYELPYLESAVKREVER